MASAHAFVFTHARRASEAVAMDAMRSSLLERGRKGKSVLREEASARNRRRLALRDEARALKLNQRSGSVTQADVVAESEESKYMAHPRVWWKQAWDYFILVMVRAAGAAGEHAALSAARQLLYNAIMVPYSISFTVYQECGQVHDANPLVYADCIPSSVKAVDLLVDILFWLDMLICFRTGYTDSRQMVNMNAAFVAKKYLSTWFAVDFLSVIPFDDIAVRSVAVSLTARSSLQLQLLRLPRLLRVGRLVKNLSSLAAADALRIVKLTVMFLLLAHWAACMFFFLGRWQVEFDRQSPFSGNLSWIQAFPGRGFAYAAADTRTRYTAALYWAVTTMTSVGYGDIVPLSSVERGFACFVELLGAISTALVFGNVALLVQGFEGAKARYRERLAALDEFIAFHSLPPALAQRLRGATEYLWVAHAGLDAGTVLADLPPTLRAGVMSYVQAGVVQAASLFRHCDPALVSAVVLRLRPQVVLRGDTIYEEGDPGQDLLFVGKGTVELRWRERGRDRPRVVRLQPGDFFGEREAFLDAPRRSATATALTHCDLYAISHAELDEALIEFPECLELVHAAAAQRRRELIDRELEEAGGGGDDAPPSAGDTLDALEAKRLAAAAAAAADPAPLLAAPAGSLAEAERMLDELMAWQSRQAKALHAKLLAVEASQAAVAKKLAQLDEVAGPPPPPPPPPASNPAALLSTSPVGLGGDGWRRTTAALSAGAASVRALTRRLSPSAAQPPPLVSFPPESGEAESCERV